MQTGGQESKSGNPLTGRDY